MNILNITNKLKMNIINTYIIIYIYIYAAAFPALDGWKPMSVGA